MAHTDLRWAWATTTKQTNALRIFKQKIVRKMNGLVKEEHCWIRTTWRPRTYYKWQIL